MNTAVILGRTTTDIELRKTQSGKSVTSFTLAVKRRFSKDETDFIDCVAWNKTAELIADYVKKGQMIAIQGYIQTRLYEDKDGNKRKAVEIVADNVSFCGSKNEGAAPDQNASSLPPAPAYATADDADFKEIPEPEDDLPF
jgi:single-strand DNA-binding protein